MLRVWNFYLSIKQVFDKISCKIIIPNYKLLYNYGKNRKIFIQIFEIFRDVFKIFA